MEAFSIVKFFSGFAFWKGEKLAKIIFIVIISGLVVVMGIGLYHKLTCPTTTNKAKEMTQNTYAPKVGFGCIRIDALKKDKNEQLIPTPVQ